MRLICLHFIALFSLVTLQAQVLCKPYKANNGRYGYRLIAAFPADTTANRVPAVYNKAFMPWVIGETECAKVFQDTLCGLVGMDGTVILPPQYDDIILADDMDDISFVARKKNEFYFFDKQFKPINKQAYLIAGAGLADNLLSVSETGLQRLEGLIYEDRRSFYFDFLPVALGDKFGVINRKGKQEIKFKYESALWASKSYNYFALQKQGLWGIVDEYGKTVIPFIYNEYFYAVDQNKEERIFKKGDRYVYVDILDGAEDTAGYLDTNNYAFTIFFHNGKQGVLRSDLKEIVPFTYDRVKLQEDFLLFRAINGNQLGFYNRDGQLIIPVEYDTEWTLEGGTYLDSKFDPEKIVLVLTKNGVNYRFNGKGKPL